jgi:hypothetical protein
MLVRLSSKSGHRWRWPPHSRNSSDCKGSRNHDASPTVETTTGQAPDGRSFAAHVFSAKQETGTFMVTVVEMPGEDCGDERGNQGGGRAGDQVRHSASRSRYQLGIAGANGGYSYVALFYRNNRLYQIEGKVSVAGGQAEADAMRFQQSLDLT